MAELRHVLRASLAGICLGGSAVGGPLEEAWDHCVLSDQPHEERIDKLLSAGWMSADEDAASYFAGSGFLTELAENPLSDTTFWNNAEQTLKKSTDPRLLAIYQEMALNPRAPRNGGAHSLMKDGAVLRIDWFRDDTERVTYCGYLQPETADLANWPTTCAHPWTAGLSTSAVSRTWFFA